MARPVNADAAATQRRILASARERFAKVGLAGASVREIAKGANVSLAMVHHYFGSKEGLYEACIRGMLEELGALGRELAGKLAGGPAKTPADIVAEAVRVGWRFARDNREAVRLLQRSIVETGEVDAEVREKGVLPTLDMVSRTFGAMTGQAPETLRLPVQSSIFLVVRYAIASDRELGDLAFGPSKGAGRKAKPAEAARAVEEHLIEAVSELLGVPG